MFCGSNAPVTVEHIFGRSISGRFTDQPIAKVPRRAADRHHPRDKNGVHYSAGAKPMSFTSKSMCKCCNGRLGTEQAKLTPILEKFFKGKTNKIPKEHLEKALRYFQRIGILVDLETAVYDCKLMEEAKKDEKLNQYTKRSPSYLTPEERLLFINGDILPNITVYLGKHRGQHGSQYTMNVLKFPGSGFSNGEKKVCGKQNLFSHLDV